MRSNAPSTARHRLAHVLFVVGAVLLMLVGCNEPTRPGRDAMPRSSASASLTVGDMVDLGTLGGSSSFAMNANRVGQVVGYSYTAGDAEQRAFRWQNGVMTDLGTLGGSFSHATAVNGLGHVVGYGATAGNAAQHAWLWKAAQMTDLGTLGGASSEAWGVNDAGQVVGNSFTAGDAAIHAFIWKAGQGMTDLGTLGGTHSYATAINTAGDVVGYAYTSANSAPHAFLWRNGVMTDLGTLGGSLSAAYGVNDAGQVVGYSYTAGDAELHPFLWQNGVMVDLGTLGGSYGYALAINGAGQVTGWSGTAGDAAQRVFVWDDGQMLDVGPASGIGEARAITDGGKIAGSRSSDGMDWRATLWSVQSVNQNPSLVVAGGARAGQEGVPVPLGIVASDPDGDPLTWTYDFDGDGVYEAGSAAASFTPPNEGSWTIGVRVTDARGGTADASVVVNATNVAPTATFAHATSVNEGSPLGLSLGAAQDVAADAGELQYAFDCGDGLGYGAFGIATSAPCATFDNGSRVARARVRDNDGGVSEYTAVIEVRNVSPTVTMVTIPSETGLGPTGVAMAPIGVAYNDPAGTLDAPYVTAIDCGNGTSANASRECSWSSLGTYQVKVTVTDKDGGQSATYTRPVTVGWRWSGFLAPVVDAPKINTERAGNSIPIKFNLAGYRGMEVLAAGYPKVKGCSAGDETLVSTSAAQGQDFRYQTTGSQYVYVWKTEREWRSSCREFVLRLADGTEHRATFLFRP